MTSIFETDRLLIRRLCPTDFPAFYELQGNPKTHRYTGSTVDDISSAKLSLERFIYLYSKPNNDFWVWAVERKSDGIMVGTVAIVKGYSGPTGEGPEIGYRFLEKYWGNGYAGEVCDPLIDYAINAMKLPWIFGQADVKNIASIKVLERSKLIFLKEYFNEKENCTDRVYRLDRDGLPISV